MKLSDYQKLSKRTMPPHGNFVEHRDTVANYCMGLCGESGELVELIKKQQFHGHNVTIDEIKKELGGVLHYLAGLATLYDIDLEDVATTNIEKLRTRYPNGFTRQDSIARKDVQG